MNPDIDQLYPYPFERLLALKSGIVPPAVLPHIALSIGEPRHQPPQIAAEAIIAELSTLGRYPFTKGIDQLRECIAVWLINRFKLPESSISSNQHIIPLTGTREGLFSFAQAVIDRSKNPLVLLPNPFYQIYEGAALLAGATPYYLNTTAESGYLPDLDSVPPTVWQQCQLIYICSPGNPTGAVMNEGSLQQLIKLSEQHDFIIASDECYSEIYLDESTPPVGLLQAAANMGLSNYKRCVVFHSLSKRSNVPGIRSGFIAGDKEIIQKYLKYRTYHGCALPVFLQHASIKLWQDENHVRQNRNLYREKFDKVLEILQPTLKVTKPEAGFYLWPETPINDEIFSQQLYQQQNITVLPGSYLSREANNINPGSNHVRIALVAEVEECIQAAHRITEYVSTI